jgi:hypothetical protein
MFLTHSRYKFSSFAVLYIQYLQSDRMFWAILSYQLSVGTVLINFYNLKILEDDPPESTMFGANKIKLNPVYKLTINKACKSTLRILNLLYFTTARYYSEIRIEEIKYIITVDHIFQSMRGIMGTSSSLLIVSPESFINLECLK